MDNWTARQFREHFDRLPTTRAINRLFARSPSEALQCLVDLKTGMERAHDLLEKNPGFNPLEGLIVGATEWPDWQTFIKRLDTFYWSSQTAALVTAASLSYPLEMEDAVDLGQVESQLKNGLTPPPPSYLPRRPSGLCVFQEPCLYVTTAGVREPLSALAWSVGMSMTRREVWLSIRGIVWTPNGAMVEWWSDGGSISHDDSSIDPEFRSERLTFTKWICTAAMFMEQEILVTAAQKPDRATLKRAMKALVEPNCHVVQLRKQLHDGSSSEHDPLGTVEWSHRWLVRGHWRRQFFPSRGTNAPVWIHPHVKGPDEKPFKEPSPTVYMVNR
jgi:hypothetical protein